MTMIMLSIFFSGLDLRYVPGTRTFNPKSKSATRHSLDRTQSPIIKVHSVICEIHTVYVYLLETEKLMLTVYVLF